MDLEFEEKDFTLKEFLAEEDDFVRARINTFVKIMAKKANVKFNDILEGSYGDFTRNFKKFQKKYGLESQFNFLGK